MANTSSVDLILEAAEIIDQDNGIRLNSEKGEPEKVMINHI